ncbi:hypothetical protein EUX98_g4228 [Antrodiella citrinella]|uniref:Uncharacterized protein n=1 Tax=Antrodiella citrinella TaxID=2447956 RepID=A0A4S4MUI3_9APHY|nr:hypothetical protein EUX98_g4228 [Antrodiella citrinella]
MSSSPGAPQPSFASIPLPPGLTLDQYLTLQGQVVTIAIVVAVGFGIIVWDYLTLLPDEIALYSASNRRLWKTPGTWFFVILRYAGLIATLPSLFFTSVQSQHCQAAVIISQVGAVLAVAASGAIFCYRVFVIWSGNNVVRGIVSLMYCIMLGCWVGGFYSILLLSIRSHVARFQIAVATQYKAIEGPATPFGSNCQPQPIVSWAPISYASSVAFDTVILIFTLAKIHTSLMMVKSDVGRQIYRDNVMYFLLTAVTNIVVLSIQSLGESHSMIKPTAVPFSTIMTVTMGSRVYLNLKLLDKRREREVEGIPLTSPMNSAGSDAYSAVAPRNRDSTMYAPSQMSHSTRPNEKNPAMPGFGYTSWPASGVVERFVPINEDTRTGSDFSGEHAR